MCTLSLSLSNPLLIAFHFQLKHFLAQQTAYKKLERKKRKNTHYIFVILKYRVFHDASSQDKHRSSSNPHGLAQRALCLPTDFSISCYCFFFLSFMRLFADDVSKHAGKHVNRPMPWLQNIIFSAVDGYCAGVAKLPLFHGKSQYYNILNLTDIITHLIFRRKLLQ